MPRKPTVNIGTSKGALMPSEKTDSNNKTARSLIFKNSALTRPRSGRMQSEIRKV